MFIPCLRFPMHVLSIKHPNEVDGKSTAVHAKILAPEDVELHTFPDFPEYDSESTVLVFPSKVCAAGACS